MRKKCGALECFMAKLKVIEDKLRGLLGSWSS